MREQMVDSITVAAMLGITVGALRVRRHHDPTWLPIDSRGPRGIGLFRQSMVLERVILAPQDHAA